MSLSPPKFLESIRIANKIPDNLMYHQQRLNRTAQDFGFPAIDLNDIASQISVPDFEVYKWRFLYDEYSYFSDIQLYIPQIISEFVLINQKKFTYPYKKTNRCFFDQTKGKLTQHTEVIYYANDYITDSSYGNIAFFTGEEWHSPEIPLLHGCMREKLICEAKIVLKNISINNLAIYKGFKLINALLGFEEAPYYPISKINFPPETEI